jgi:hypothetical protein
MSVGFLLTRCLDLDTQDPSLNLEQAVDSNEKFLITTISSFISLHGSNKLRILD